MKRKFTILFLFAGIVVYQLKLKQLIPDTSWMRMLAAGLVGMVSGLLGALLDRYYAAKEQGAEPPPPKAPADAQVPTAVAVLTAARTPADASAPPAIPPEIAARTTPPTPTAQAAPSTAKDNRATAGMVLGIIALLAWILPLAGLPVALIGLLLAMRAHKIVKSGMSRAGIVLCAIGIMLSGAHGIAGAYLATAGKDSLFADFSWGKASEPVEEEIVEEVPSGPAVEIVDRTVDDNRMDSQGWKDSRRLLRVTATMSTRSGTRAAVVNGELVSLGDFVEVDVEGRIYRWTIASIGNSDITWEPLDVTE